MDYYIIKDNIEKFRNALVNYLIASAERTESFAPEEFESLQLKEKPEAYFKIKDKHMRAEFIKDRAGVIKGMDNIKNLPEYYKRNREIDDHTIHGLVSEYGKNILNYIQLEERFKDDEILRWPEKFDKLSGLLDAAIADNDAEAVQEVKNLINNPDMSGVQWPDELIQKIEAFENKE